MQTTTSTISPAQGGLAGGGNATISGTAINGSEVNQVLIGGANAPIISFTSDSVTVTVPQSQVGAQSAPVTVYTNGIAGIISAQYTYEAPQIISLSVSEGGLAGGTSVAITGQYLGGVSLVQFGSGAATIVGTGTDSEITVLTPNAAAAESISVTASAFGVQSTQNGTFTYAAPIVTSLNITTGPQTGGTAIVITGQYFTGASEVIFSNASFSVPVTSGFTIVDDTTIHVNTPAAPSAGMVDTQVMVQGVSSATGTGDQFTYQPAVLAIAFTNNTNGNYTDDQILIGFFDQNAPGVPAKGTTPGITYAVPNGTYNVTKVVDGSQIQPLQLSPDFITDAGSGYGYPFAGNWYSLSELSDGVNLTNFAGRIYMVYGGTGWSFPAVENGGWGYTPDSANVNSPDFFTRYDQMELTFNGSATDVADMTSINFWAIPITLTTSLNGTQVSSVTGMQNSATPDSINAALSALAPTAVVPGSFTANPGVTYEVPPGSFARIIGPASYSPNTGTSPYDDLNDYLSWLIATFGLSTTVGSPVAGLGNGTIATISGSFAGLKCPEDAPSCAPYEAQTYALTATIDSNGDITLTGSASVAGSFTMYFSNADLISPPGIYGGNVAAKITPAPYNNYPSVPGNDVFGWIAADLYLGLNTGAIGSSVANAGGAMVGALPSSAWYSLGLLFSALQPGNTYYNQWAATLQPMSQAYNFAYSDRLSAYTFQISLNPEKVDTLSIGFYDMKSDS